MRASRAGGLNVIGLTIGPISMFFVHSAASASEIQHSMQSWSGRPFRETKWSLRLSEANPRRSVSWQMLRQRSQLRPSWPSIMIPTCAISESS